MKRIPLMQITEDKLLPMHPALADLDAADLEALCKSLYECQGDVERAYASICEESETAITLVVNCVAPILRPQTEAMLRQGMERIRNALRAILADAGGVN